MCVFDKISLTINAINDICTAIANVFNKPRNLTALKALEETLEQYLNDIDLDLKFIDPVVSILDIFLQLLNLIFRFPCQISPAEGDPDCGVDGTLLAGLVMSVAAPESIMNPEALIPVAQTYSTDPNGDVNFLSMQAINDVVADNSGQTFLNSMNVEDDSLRANSSYDFNPTFAPCFTKSTRKGRKSGRVEFKFNYNGKTNTFRSNVNIDPNQTTDAPFALFKIVDTQLIVTQNGNMFSPIDGLEFLDVDSGGNTASVKPLTLNLEIPITQVDEQTGQIVQVGVEIIPRTFDNIPMMAIIDDESNVYFVEKNGIKFNSDGFVDEIIAKIVNDSSAPKFKFTKEDVEIDSQEVNLYDFPQIYFFDMRQVGEQLQQYCITSSINSFPLEDNNVEDIFNIVKTTQDCIVGWKEGVSNLVTQIREVQQSGNPDLAGISLSQFNSFNQTVTTCIEDAIDNICKYVINSLNTSFKVLEDVDPTPNKEYVDGDLPQSVLEGFTPGGPRFTGAREYAAGIGDNGEVTSGEYATIEIIPRDAYDNEVDGDFSQKISIEILSDETGGAELVKYPDDSFIAKNGNTYTARITSSGVGLVKVRAKVCERIIQALMYQEVNESISISEPGCVPGSISELSSTSPPIGSLVKVDRILSIYFKEKPPITATIKDEALDIALTDTQQFGTSLEN